MKVALLGDTHLGMRKDSLVFAENFDRFYEEVFFPTLDERGIDTVIQLGDLFERRKFVNFQLLSYVKRTFFDGLKRRGKTFHTILGNHDVYHKDTLRINSPSLLLQEYDNVTVYDHPCTLCFGGVYIDLIPWICADNAKEIEEFIQNTTSKIAFGHFEISGFEMEIGNMCTTGMDRMYLEKYSKVFSGHFHHRSTDGHIYYVGTPGEMTWFDFNDQKGFHVLEIEGNKATYEFIKNPFNMFYEIPYDDKEETTFDVIKNTDFEMYHQKYVKVMVHNKQNPYLFETFMDMLYKARPEDVSIVETYVTFDPSKEMPKETTKDTITLLTESVDDIELDDNKELLKETLRNLYREATMMTLME